LACENFDLGITLPASVSSAFLLFAAGIPRRIGFAQGGAEIFLTSSRPWKGREAGCHKSHLYLELLEWMSARTVEARPTRMAPPVAEPRIVIAPGASIVLREWPYFLELIRALRACYPSYRIQVVGGPAEEKWHEQLVGLGDPAIEDLVGKTSLPELRALCAKAQLVVANDSGVAHVAATLARAPTMVLFGPGDPEYIRPQGPRVFALRVEGLPCSPCEKAVCREPYGYQECLRSLKPEVVLREAARVLSL
jgi:ADP-heptose:LPS heptosyltransferase